METTPTQRALLVGYGEWGQTLAKKITEAGYRLAVIVEPDDARRDYAKRAHPAALCVPALDWARPPERAFPHPAMVVQPGAVRPEDLLSWPLPEHMVVGGGQVVPVPVGATATWLDNRPRQWLTHAFVASPPRLHYWHARWCLDAGLHTFVEKPLATNRAEVRALVTQARHMNVALHVNHLYRYMREPLDWILERAIGPIKSYTSRRFSTENHPRHGSILHDLLVHEITLLYELMGSSGWEGAPTALTMQEKFCRWQGDRFDIQISYGQHEQKREQRLVDADGRHFVLDDQRSRMAVVQTGDWRTRRRFDHDALADSISEFGDKAHMAEGPDDRDLAICFTMDRLAMMVESGSA